MSNHQDLPLANMQASSDESQFPQHSPTYTMNGFYDVFVAVGCRDGRAIAEHLRNLFVQTGIRVRTP
ncbi:MAG: hypothetical protein AAF327_12500, partial [Cyanobacteria bacterium P01_A01_bin.37]